MAEIPEMVKRVAHAICGLGEKCCMDRSEDCFPEAQARAAIAAMREPTPPMVDKAWSLIGSNLRYEEAYRHLNDAALTDPSPEETRP